MNEPLDHSVVFCGGGPAAIGPIVHAASEGRLGEFLDRGVCIVERGDAIGPGSIGHYPISANTQGATFLRALETDAARAVFGDIWSDPATRDLQRLRDAYPHLPVVGAHLEKLGALVADLLAAHDRCSVLTRHTVKEVRLLPGGGVAVRAIGPTGELREMTAAVAVVAMGGTPRTVLGVPDEHRAKACHADALLDNRVGLPAPLAQAVRDTGELVVIGGSHSAWSAAWLALRAAGLRDSAGRAPAVTLLHRSPIRLSFRTASLALAAGYRFDAIADVCARTGMVNRHAGLRADALALAGATLAHTGRGLPPVRAIDVADDPAAAQRALAGAGAIVAATGYDAALPLISLPDGSPLQVATDTGGLLVTPHAQVVTAARAPVPGLLAYGLGAGLPPTGELAGEPSYHGRVDAVRLYEAEAGRIVVDAVLTRSSLVDDGRRRHATLAVGL